MDYGVEKNSRSSFRDLVITDHTKGHVNATIWGKEADSFNCEIYLTIIIRNGIVVLYEEVKKVNCIAECLVWVIFFLFLLNHLT